MRAAVVEVTALPIDRMMLTPLPDGVLDVQIRLYADAEAFQHLVDYFKARGYGRKQDADPDSLPVLKLSDGSL